MPGTVPIYWCPGKLTLTIVLNITLPPIINTYDRNCHTTTRRDNATPQPSYQTCCISCLNSN
eukprot:CCRYP_013736-RA/>CCRYP_013736-RA protein AED:0.63 eAED:1.00 QI:0/-1/0/1/-1/0/1/0/61